MPLPRIKHVRAFTTTGGGADCHDQQGAHWIDDHIATPMARYPEYRASRRSFGINVLGTLVVKIEAEDGTVGFAVTTGGEPACFIVERHLARSLEGRDRSEVEKIWDQMYFSIQYYGRAPSAASRGSRKRSRPTTTAAMRRSRNRRPPACSSLPASMRRPAGASAC